MQIGDVVVYIDNKNVFQTNLKLNETYIINNIAWSVHTKHYYIYIDGFPFGFEASKFKTLEEIRKEKIEKICKKMI